ncbi:hypothetical protein [Microtetraspora fusca]|uniref:hypothetical protein n=1 Tax=Microtetraspora fusca TaxID=1997 RepID=UPI0008297768|nr:hypothetical protein [Microtetraspora fusca]
MITRIEIDGFTSFVDFALTCRRSSFSSAPTPAARVSVAEAADISESRKVPAFRQWWNDMIEALEGLGYQHG